MPNLKIISTDLVIVLAQIIVVYIVIAVSLFNLTKGSENKELWVSLLSSSVGYLLPSPVFPKNVRDASE